MSTSIDEYYIPTAQTPMETPVVDRDTLEIPLTDAERATFDALTAAATSHTIDPETEPMEVRRIESLGTMALSTPEATFDYNDPAELLKPGRFIMQFREIEKTLPREK